MSGQPFWTFDRFEPGALVGESELVLDREQILRWKLLFPGENEAEAAPPGLLIAMLMKGYMQVIASRPPGNVHAGQSLRWTGARVTEGARLKARFHCLDKEIRKERRWLHLSAELSAGGTPVLSGEMTMLWAA